MYLDLIKISLIRNNAARVTSTGESETDSHLQREIKMYTEDNKYDKAKKRVRMIKGFYIHLAVYVLVNILLFLINILTSPGVFWFYWPLLGWGIGLASHAIFVYGSGSWFDSDWEEKKIAEMLEKEQNV